MLIYGSRPILEDLIFYSGDFLISISNTVMSDIACLC